MSDSVGGGIEDSIAGAAQTVADGAQRAVCGAACGVGEVRDVMIRAQPIIAAVVVLALGYLLGRLRSLIPSSHSTGGRR
jgi:hypothetical protein